MTELEHKAVKQSLAYNRKYSEDRNLENVLKHPEEYVDSYAYTMRIVQMLRQKAYRDGYNAGAKENEIVWHDLRKNPNDLPEKGHKVIAVYHDFGHTHLLAYLREDWVWTTNGHNAFDGIIAWCEIPKFEVKE